MTRRTRRLVGVGAVAILACIPTAVQAHPRGQRPVLLLARNADGLDASWIAAADELAAIGRSLGLGPIAVTAFDEQQAYRDYLADGITVRLPGGTTCTPVLLDVEEVATGYASTLDIDCGGPIEQATLEISLLFELSDAYVHELDAVTAGGTVRRSLTAIEPSIEIAFTDETPVAIEQPDARGRLEAFARGEAGLSPLLAFMFALVLGAGHGLTPGHGKTLAVAYVAGTHGTLRHAGLLAGIVAAAHGASTLVLALLATSVDKLAPQRLTPWLDAITVALTAGVGIALLRGRGHAHHREEGPLAVRAPKLGTLALVGLIGGLIPSPEAFAVVFSAVAVGEPGAATIAVLAFSLGLGLIVFAVSAVAVFAGDRIARGHRLEHLVQRSLGALFLVVAVVLAVRALLRN